MYKGRSQYEACYEVLAAQRPLVTDSSQFLRAILRAMGRKGTCSREQFVAGFVLGSGIAV